MNTYFFGMRSQKESYTDLGQVYSLPIRYVNGFDRINGDTTKIVLVGRKNDKQRDLSLFLATRDTSKESELQKKGLKKKKNNNFQKIKPIWEFKELDYGRISDYVKVSPDGKYIAYAKYGYGKNQSLWLGCTFSRYRILCQKEVD